MSFFAISRLFCPFFSFNTLYYLLQGTDDKFF